MKPLIIRCTVAFAAVHILFVSILSSAALSKEAERFGAWSLLCDDAVCQVFTSAMLEEDDTTQVSASLVYDSGKEQYSAIFQVPEGVAIGPGLNAWLSPQVAQVSPFQYCAEGFCYAVALLDAKFVDAMERTEYLILEFVPYGAREKVSRPLFLKGFEAARARLVGALQ